MRALLLWLAVLAYLFALRLWRSRSLAFFVTLAFTLTTPVFFYSFHAFPEVQAMLLKPGEGLTIAPRS